MSYPFRSWVEVSRQQIADNYRAVRAVVGPSAEVMPVVKADAYRHGAVEVSHILTREGVRWLAVSNVEEGIILRQAGIPARILVMADFLPAERPALIEYDLTPTLHTLEHVRELDRLGAILNRRLDFHLKIDSGMGRLGTCASPGEILDCLRAAPHTHLEGLMTHFASSADYTSPQTDRQVAHFDAILRALRTGGVRPAFVHLASTNPVAYGRSDTWRDPAATPLVRPGHAIYGYVSQARGEQAPGRVLDVRPALTWRAAILAVKDLPAGALVGYGGMYRTTRPTRVAILAAGYADGLPHRLSNRGRVIAAGRFAPILGAVSMDVTTIDITDTPALQAGDAVTLIGREGDVSQDAQQLGRLAGTISYSILCGISARVKRVYV